MSAAVVAWAVAMATLTAAAIYLWRENRRNPGPPSRLHQVLASHDQAEKDRLDSMAGLYRDRREEPQQTVAWPPEAERPGLVPAVPPGITSPLASPVDLVLLDCGCIWAYYRTHTALSPCVIHDQDHWRGLEDREGINL